MQRHGLSFAISKYQLSSQGLAEVIFSRSANHMGPDSQSNLISYGFVTFQKLLFVNHRTIAHATPNAFRPLKFLFRQV
jgi:hypothetical protein